MLNRKGGPDCSRARAVALGALRGAARPPSAKTRRATSCAGAAAPCGPRCASRAVRRVSRCCVRVSRACARSSRPSRASPLSRSPRPTTTTYCPPRGSSSAPRRCCTASPTRRRRVPRLRPRAARAALPGRRAGARPAARGPRGWWAADREGPGPGADALDSHEVIDAALHADPGRLVADRRERRRQELRFPALSRHGGDVRRRGAAFIDALGAPLGLMIDGPSDGRWLVRAADVDTLADALAAVSRPRAGYASRSTRSAYDLALHSWRRSSYRAMAAAVATLSEPTGPASARDEARSHAASVAFERPWSSWPTHEADGGGGRQLVHRRRALGQLDATTSKPAARAASLALERGRHLSTTARSGRCRARSCGACAGRRGRRRRASHRCSTRKPRPCARSRRR